MKKEISVPIAVVAAILLLVASWYIFQQATGPIRSESPSPDATKMSRAELEKVKRLTNPDNVH